jgi:hypothetical protein
MGSAFEEGQGRLCTGYGAVDDALAFQEGEGIFTEARGLEPYFLAHLDRKYAIYGSEEYLSPSDFSPVPLGRQAIYGEDLGQSAVIAESQMVSTTYRDQPEAIGKQVGRTAESNLWRADAFDPVGYFTNNPDMVVALALGIGFLAFLAWYKKNVR